MPETSRASVSGRQPGMEPGVRGAGQMAFLSNLLAAYSFISEHPERAALCFVSGVCVGLALTLAALLLSGSCRADCGPRRGRRGAAGRGDPGDSGDDSDDSGDGCSSRGSARGPWLFERPPHRNVFTSAEELERAQRLEERERILREIWLNGQPDGPATRSLNRYY